MVCVHCSESGRQWLTAPETVAKLYRTLNIGWDAAAQGPPMARASEDGYSHQLSEVGHRVEERTAL